MVLDYLTLKVVHVSAVAVSGAGFLARGLGAWRGAAWVRSRAARTLPHLVDTVLLLSAIGMLVIVRVSPWAVLWLRAKIIGLVCYIGLGAIALRGLRRRVAAVPPAETLLATGAHVPDAARRGRVAARSGGVAARGPGVARTAWVLALLVFAFIVSVALTKSPWGVFELLRR